MAVGRSREYLALDLETTGLVAEFDRVVEVGAVRFDAGGSELGRYERLINPGRPMPLPAQAVHGLSDADLAGAATAREVLPEFVAFLGDPGTTTLLAHNAWFDAGFLGRELDRLGRAPPAHAVVDTLTLARQRLPGLRNHRLDTIARALDLDPDGPHRAMADSLRVKGLWLALGGPDVPPNELIAYPIHDAGRPSASPVGWDVIAAAITTGSPVRMVYTGGTRGTSPRVVTPRGFVRRGGVAYLVAYCHLDSFEKRFRLDRVRWYEVIP
jgi:DNA polymerase III epsilon subunit family exonuclease